MNEFSFHFIFILSYYAIANIQFDYCSKLKRDSGPHFENNISETDRLLLQKDEEVSVKIKFHN